MNIAKHFCWGLGPHKSRLAGSNRLAVVGKKLNRIRPLLIHQHLYHVLAHDLATDILASGTIDRPFQELMQGFSVWFPVPAHMAHVSCQTVSRMAMVE